MTLTGEYAPSTSEWARTQAELFESTNGAEGNLMRGKPIIVLTTMGAQSGKLRKTALMRVEHEGEYAVVASKGGAPDHPKWYFNLLAEPHVELADVGFRGDFTARMLSGAERELWWHRSLEVWPDYAGYQEKTDREIPVFVLTPIERS